MSDCSGKQSPPPNSNVSSGFLRFNCQTYWSNILRWLSDPSEVRARSVQGYYTSGDRLISFEFKYGEPWMERLNKTTWWRVSGFDEISRRPDQTFCEYLCHSYTGSLCGFSRWKWLSSTACVHRATLTVWVGRHHCHCKPCNWKLFSLTLCKIIPWNCGATPLFASAQCTSSSVSASLHAPQFRLFTHWDRCW